MARQTSAPVFAEVAQQVLEYLGVPHDQPLKTKKEMMAAQKDDGRMMRLRRVRRT